MPIKSIMQIISYAEDIRIYHYFIFIDIVAIPQPNGLTLIKTLVIPITIRASRCLAIVVLAARSKATNVIAGAPE
jgi:hypothetical protein